MKVHPRVLRFGLIALLVLALAGGIATAGAYFYIVPDLPSIDKLQDVKLQVPLRVYSADGALIAEYGDKRRNPLRYEQLPKQMVQAILAAEDDRFFEHPGVDYQGIVRAVIQLALTGEKRQGGSTITMQVARNYFLTRKKTYSRKLREIFLALQIEDKLTKEEILELYLNKIYLGNRAYGVGAAAEVYYGCNISELTLPQLAMIAGLPKAPSRYNPIVNPSRALTRRNYVLGRMHDLDFIDDATYQAAIKAPVTASLHDHPADLNAPYVAEMVRSDVLARYGEEDTYTAGYKVYTTIDTKHQRAANHALRNGLLAYDRRHGWRGPVGHEKLPPNSGMEQWAKLLGDTPTVGHLIPALVVKVGEKDIQAYFGKPELAKVDWEGLKWARRYIDENRRGANPKTASDIVKAGDVVYLEARGDGGWMLSQVPQVEGALVSLRPLDGRVLALVGGFDFYQSKFNRVLQAHRQPGSNFKPFVYSAALANGMTAATMINDAPVVFEDSALEDAWRPQNYSGRFFGPTRLREGLYRSRNLVSIRVLRRVGIDKALEHAKKFGFDPDELPHNLSLALGSANLTPMQVVRGYSVFANGGFLISPYFIERIEDGEGNILFQTNPLVACDDNCGKVTAEDAVPETETAAEGDTTGTQIDTAATAPEAPIAESTPDSGAVPAPADIVEPVLPLQQAPRTVDAQNVYLMTTMMQDVIRLGTGRKALQMDRHDLAGKTGTTNDQRDAWFSGFNPEVVTTTWVGFDNPRPLGSRETGAGAALPIWIDYMEDALDGIPDRPLKEPPGLVTVRIDPTTGLAARADDPNAIFETFRSENVPDPTTAVSTQGGSGDAKPYTEQLF